VPLSELFRHPTIAALADHLAGAGAGPVELGPRQERARTRARLTGQQLARRRAGRRQDGGEP
jgi:hypothetical protein